MSDEIVIVGVGCRFPGADNLEEFWRVLVQGENHVREVDNERWDFYRYYDPDIHAEGKSYVNKAGLLKNIDKWDNQLFGVSDNEAKVVDPQQRLVLECCHMAMEDAGITRKRLNGSQTSVYIGAMNDDFSARKNNFAASDSAYTVTGIFRSILSARVSYTFNLKGPCMVVDTACSSSLCAIHLACQSLKLKESDLSFAGGVSVLLDPVAFVALSKAHMLSPTGQCQTFTADANGYARGEGCGMVILQRVEDAIREGNNIWGVIKTGTNQDGRMVTPMTAPSGVQQLELLRKIYNDRETDRNDVQFIEAHGTGTPIGDPTEVSALGEFFKDSENAKRNKIRIGSVKTNIGHLESAAGVAGLIKIILMMRNEKIVPSILYSEEKRNPKIDFKSFNMIVPTDLTDWKLNSNRTRTACVNSFGFGGSNSHLLIKQWVPKTMASFEHDHLGISKTHLFVISSQDNSGLIRNIKQFNEDLEKTSSALYDIAITSQSRRDHFKKRAAIVAKSKEDLKKQCLRKIKLAENKKLSGTLRFVYVFCGVGTTWKGMCYELLQNKIFLEAVMPIDEKLQNYTGWSITNKWKNRDDISDPFASHLSIFVCQIGLAALWKVLGIKPNAIVGQSVGEVAACYTAGIIDEDSAVKIIFHRSFQLSQYKSGGMMVVRNVDVTKIERMCKHVGKINIAVYLSPVACTVAGEKTAITQLESALRHQTSAVLKILDVSCGYHSSIVKAAGNTLQSCLTGSIKAANGVLEVPIISTVYGKEIDRREYCKATYWKDNMLKPVKFHDAISQALYERAHTVFIEIGPSPVLKAHSSDIFGEISNYEVIPSMEKGNEYSALLQAFASIYEIGSDVDPGVLQDSSCEIRPALIPKYVFNRKIFPLPKEFKTQPNLNSVKDVRFKKTHQYIFIKDSSNYEDFMEIRISPETTPYVYHHFVRESIIVPGALYADVGFETGSQLLQLPPDQLHVTLDFLMALPVNKNESLLMKVRVKEKKYKNRRHFSFLIDNESVTVCKGMVKEENKSRKIIHTNLDSITIDLHQKVSTDDYYGTLQSAGFKYGPQLTVMKDGFKNQNRSLINMDISDEVIGGSSICYLHPCILDGMLQTTVIFSKEGIRSQCLPTKPTQFLPVGMDCVKITKNLNNISQKTDLKVLTEKVSHVCLETMKKQHFNIYLLDGYGYVLAEIKNFTMYAANGQMKCCDDLRYTLTWRPAKDGYEHSYFGGTEKTLVLINASYAVSSFFKNSEFKVDYCNFEGALSGENRKFLGERIKRCSKIVMFFTSDMRCIDDGQQMFDAVSRNVKLLHEFVLYIMNQGTDVPELYLVTQGVHSEQYPERYVKDTSLIGSEVWGFFRNLQTEFVYRNITMIDIASLSFESLKTLLVLMGKTDIDQHQRGREFMICGKDVYELDVNATSKRYQMPMLRCHNKQYRSRSSNYVLCSSRRNQVDEPHFIYDDADDLCLRSPGNPCKELEVEKICVHDSNLYPVTEVAWSGNFNIQSEKQDESDYRVIAIEIIGRKHSPTNYSELCDIHKK